MKKIALLIIVILSSFAVYSQDNANVYLGLGATNKGILYQIGLLADNIEFQAQYKMAGANNLTPSIASVSIGYQIKGLVTPSIGYGISTVKEIKRTQCDDLIKKVSTGSFIYSLEVGHSSFHGRYFAVGTFSGGKFFAGIGMKMYLKEIIKD